MVQHLLGDTAEQDANHTAAPVRAHDDEIALLLFGGYACRAVTFAFIAFAICTARLTVLADTSDPSVGTSTFLNISDFSSSSWQLRSE